MHSIIVFLQCLRCAMNGKRYYSKNPLLRCQVHGGLYPAIFFSSTLIATWCLSSKRFKDMKKLISKAAKEA